MDDIIVGIEVHDDIVHLDEMVETEQIDDK